MYTETPPFEQCLVLRDINQKEQKAKMTDMFDNVVLCKKCNVKMKPARLVRNGFEMRALICDRCGNKIVHPADEADYNNFLSLKNKIFKVKMRIVGNSYAVSIPKEIVDFIKIQEKIMNDMVSLCFNDAKKLSLTFDSGEEKEIEEEE